MKYLFTICLATLVFTFTAFSQAKNVTHKVEKGETITQIAQKYNVTPHDIYQLNPDAITGLKPNTVLLIPNKTSKAIIEAKPKVVPATKSNPTVQTHKVEPKETLFGIEKKYGISDEALKKANPELEKLGMQIGQTLTIPSNVVSKSTASKTTVPSQEKAVYHVVYPKETKFSIAKLYGISIAELEKRNPEIIPNLPIGYKLLIKGNTPKAPKIAVIETKKEIAKPNPTKVVKKIEYSDYEVQSKETLYSLSKKFGMTTDELINLNPDIENGVKEFMILKVPSTTLISKELKKVPVSLSNKSGNSTRKKLVLLLPFDLSKIEEDTINSTSTRLKKDKFLNMTLDFYSGALVAIDSARSIGIPIDVKIFDSQETKTASNIPNIIQENHLEDADAIVGPFYQSNVEKTAEIVGKNNVPVISPLSKDIGNSYANLYQTIPTVEVTKKAMFDFMIAKSGNIIAVIDKKKESVRQYIKENQKEVQFAALQENGSLAAESLKSLFVKDKINYVILETANTGMIKATMNTMLGSMANYKVQLVILSPNETLDTDEIEFGNLVKLKLMYPSVTRENKSPEALVFENEYRKKNNIYPSGYATRGFDVTFDTMMRLS
ncbi:LysM peptidoglycan-binding domain-containing protein, partial [Flavobacterium sp.]|uniref:LysM peptidoglycan-binding domain-containing protein n=1 Tax=Flavobacterium sp. TaxID=239 RepID=UPI00379640B7